jgi:ribosomal protein S14
MRQAIRTTGFKRALSRAGIDESDVEFIARTADLFEFERLDMHVDLSGRHVLTMVTKCGLQAQVEWECSITGRRRSVVRKIARTLALTHFSIRVTTHNGFPGTAARHPELVEDEEPEWTPELDPAVWL